MLNSISTGTANNAGMAMYLSGAGSVDFSANNTRPVTSTEEQQSDSNSYDSRKAEVQKRAYEIARRVSQNGLGVEAKISQMKTKIAQINNQTNAYRAKAMGSNESGEASAWTDTSKKIAEMAKKNSVMVDDLKGGMVNIAL